MRKLRYNQSHTHSIVRGRVLNQSSQAFKFLLFTTHHIINISRCMKYHRSTKKEALSVQDLRGGKKRDIS